MTTHQIWLGDKIPDIFLEYRQIWLERFPEFHHMFHKDDDLRNLIKEHYYEYLDLYDSFEYNIERIDFFRCAMLHYYGGIYVDLDVLPLKDFKTLLDLDCIVLGYEPHEHMKHWDSKHPIIGNAFMISPAGDPFWLDLMDYIKENYRRGRGPVYNTGPICFSKFYLEHPEKFKKVRIEPPNSFYPITNGEGNKTEIFEGIRYNHVAEGCQVSEAYVVHLWSGSWGKEVSKNSSMASASFWWIVLYAFLTLVIIVTLSVIIIQNGK